MYIVPQQPASALRFAQGKKAAPTDELQSLTRGKNGPRIPWLTRLL